MRLLVIFLIAVCAQSLDAQTKSLWQVLPKSASTSYMMYRAESRAPHLETVFLDWSALQNDYVNLPVQGRNYLARRVSLEASDTQEGTWYGRIDGSPFLSVVVWEGDRFSAFIWTDGERPKLYQVTPTISGNVLRLADSATSFSDEVFPQSQALQGVSMSKRRAVSPGGEGCGRGLYPLYTIDLLFLYDDSYTYCPPDEDPQWCIDPLSLETRFKGHVALMNAILQNSGIPYVRFKYVGVEKRGYFTDKDLFEEAYFLIDDPWVHDMRDTHNADMIVFAVGGRPSRASGVNIGWLSVMFLPNALWHILPHELGHGLGGAHQREMFPGVKEFDAYYNFAYSVEGKFRTIVGVSDPKTCSLCDSIPVFSTPSVSFDGEPVGIANDRDNARAVREKMKEVSEYKQGTPSQCVDAATLNSQ